MIFTWCNPGKVTVSCPDESGKEVNLATLGQRTFFGEISLLDGGPRTATVRTLGRYHAPVAGPGRFSPLSGANPKAAVHMLTVLANGSVKRWIRFAGSKM